MERMDPFARLRVFFLAVQIRFNDILLSTAPAVINHISFTHLSHPQRTIVPKPGQVDPEDRSHITATRLTVRSNPTAAHLVMPLSQGRT